MIFPERLIFSTINLKKISDISEIYFKIKEKIRDKIRFSSSKMTLTAFLSPLLPGQWENF